MIADDFARAVRIQSGGGKHPGLSLSQLCAACAEVTSLWSAVVLASPDEPQTQAVMAASDGATPIEELQFTLGEGPGIDALAEGRPILVDNLGTMTARWPQFASGAQALGMQAVFAFPLLVGAIRTGVVSFYADHIAPLAEGQLEDLAVLANLVTSTVLAMQSEVATEELAWSLADAADDHAAVHQATGMVAIQVGCSMQDALVRLRARAFADGVSVNEVGQQVVERQLRFE